MKKYRIVLFALLLNIHSVVFAYTPTADDYTMGLFTDWHWNSLPAHILKKEPLSKMEGGTENYVVNPDRPIYDRNYFVFNESPAWYGSNFSFTPTWYRKMNNYPSFSDPRNKALGQCVDFAKVITRDFHGATTYWRSSDYVIPPLSRYAGWDDSWKHRGKMVAYFGNTSGVKKGTKYPAKAPYGHVGVFLKYAYSPSIRNGLKQIIGFWIVDQNYEGTGYDSNQDGRIRKHLILLKPILNKNGRVANHAYAGGYHFVDIK